MGKIGVPGVTQTWYIGYSGALGLFDNIGLYFNLLKHFGRGRGYYPKPPSVIIVHLNNLASGKEFGLLHWFKVWMGKLYLGGLIGDDESEREWIKDRTLTWEKHICAITKMAGK